MRARPLIPSRRGTSRSLRSPIRIPSNAVAYPPSSISTVRPIALTAECDPLFQAGHPDTAVYQHPSDQWFQALKPSTTQSIFSATSSSCARPSVSTLDTISTIFHHRCAFLDPLCRPRALYARHPTSPCRTLYHWLYSPSAHHRSIAGLGLAMASLK